MKKEMSEKINRADFKKSAAKINFDWFLFFFITIVIVVLVFLIAK